MMFSFINFYYCIILLSTDIYNIHNTYGKESSLLREGGARITLAKANEERGTLFGW